jgi:hypothetical protein
MITAEAGLLRRYLLDAVTQVEYSKFRENTKESFPNSSKNLPPKKAFFETKALTVSNVTLLQMERRKGERILNRLPKDTQYFDF